MSFAKALIAALVMTATTVVFGPDPAFAKPLSSQTDWAAQVRAAGADPGMESLIRRKRTCFYRHGPRGPGYYPCRRRTFLLPYFHRGFFHHRHGRRIFVRPLAHPHLHRRINVDGGSRFIRPHRARLGGAAAYGVRTRALRHERFGTGFGGAPNHGVVHQPGVTPGPRIGVGQGVPIGRPQNLGANFRGNLGGANVGGIGAGNAARIGGGAHIGGAGQMGGGAHIGGGGGHMGGAGVGGHMGGIGH